MLFTPAQERNMFENKVPPMLGNLISDELSADEILLPRLPFFLLPSPPPPPAPLCGKRVRPYGFSCRETLARRSLIVGFRFIRI